MFFNKKSAAINAVESVEKYYDEWTDRYIAEGGELIEAFRAKNDDETLSYYIQSAQINNGQKILDAGCGVCGPAAYFAENYDVTIDALTVSKIQIERSQTNLKKHVLKGKVNVIKGDFHKMSEQFNSDYYDRVVFIESLGHSSDPEKVISEAHKILKTGGCIYIKDFFKKESKNQTFLNKCNEVVNNINVLYAYNTLDLHRIISALRKENFEIIYLRIPQFTDDISVRLAFETKNGINIFGNHEPFYVADWLEIFCRKV